jgi:hypothetical protein
VGKAAEKKRERVVRAESTSSVSMICTRIIMKRGTKV